MIKLLDVKNFQSHRSSRLEFTAGVNILVGTSDSGKSAALRALLWLATNRPSGDAFRSTWGGATQVEVVVDDSTICRIKDKGINEYTQHTLVPHQSLTYKALGQDVPAEIVTALGLADVNVQHQMDSPFLLSNDWSPGRVAAYLNEVAGLDVIDRAQTGINARARQITADLGREIANLAVKQGEHDALNYLQDFEKELVDVERASAQASAVRRDEQALNTLAIEIVDLQARIATLPNYQQVEKDVDVILIVIGERKLALDEWQKLQTTVYDIIDVEAELTGVRKVANAEPQVLTLIADDERAASQDNAANALAVLIADIADLTTRSRVHAGVVQGDRLLSYMREQYDTCMKADNTAQALQDLLGNIYEAEDLLVHNGEALADLEAQWEAVAPDVCPLCAGTGKLK